MFTRFPDNIDSPRGGIESVAAALVPALARRSFLDIEVVTLERDRQELAIESHDGFRVHRLPGTHWPQLADVMIGPGHFRLQRYLRDLDVDVVHSHETYGLELSHLGVPQIMTVHGFDTRNIPAENGYWMHLRKFLWRRLERHGLARQHDIIAISPYVHRKIQSITDATIYDVENPVDERFYRLTRNIEQPPRVLFVGWLNPRKNPFGALRMFLDARRRGAEGTLVLAGTARDPEYEKRICGLIDAEEVSHCVELPGHLDRSALLDELSRASVLLLPSRQENAPMAIAEAMAAGVPVVASDRCGMPHMVAHGWSGFLIEPDAISDAGEMLYRLMTDRHLVTSMGHESARIAQRWRPDAIALRTAAIYRRLVALRRIGAA
jgi:glycosyltransferase involved in cell wall biosynthesis